MHSQFRRLMNLYGGSFPRKLGAVPEYESLYPQQYFPSLSVSDPLKFHSLGVGSDSTLNHLDAELPSNSRKKAIPIDDTALRIQNLLCLSPNSSDEELAKVLASCELSLTDDLVVAVLRRHHSDWEPAFRFFSWLFRVTDVSEYMPGSDACNEMLGILGKAKRFKELHQVFDEMFKRGVMNERSYDIVVHRFAAAHMVDEAIAFFNKRRQYGLELDIVAFQTLLLSLCRYKHVESAETLFYLKKGEFQYDIKTWNILLNGWCVRGNLRESKRFWNEIIHSQCRPDKYTYGILINTLCKSGKASSALKLFRTMLQEGYSPDVVICNSVIDGLCFKKRIPEALEIFRDMKEKVCEPNLVTYNCLIKHMCNIRRLETVIQLLLEMEEKGGSCSPNSTTYCHLLAAAKNPEDVSSLLERMKTNGCKMTGDTYNLLLRLYMNWDCKEEVESTWAEMLRDGMGPDQRSYTIMIHMRHAQGRTEDALSYFNEMVSKGMIPEPRTKLLVHAMENKSEENTSNETSNNRRSRRAWRRDKGII